MSWLDSMIGGLVVANSGAALPTEPTLNFDSSFTIVNDPSNGRNTVTGGGGGGITALIGDVVASGTGSVASHVEILGGATPGASDILLPVGNNLKLSGADSTAIIDTRTAPGYVGIGGPADGSGDLAIYMTTTSANGIVINNAMPTTGSIVLGADVVAVTTSALGSGFTFDFQNPKYLMVVPQDAACTDFAIGFQLPNLTGNGRDASYCAETAATGTNANGGYVNFYGGAKDGTGKKGGVRLAVNGSTAEIMCEIGEAIAGQRVVSLAKGAALTSTQMPANTGDRVIYVADAATNPSANPAGGAIVWSQSGVVHIRQSDGTTFPIAAGGLPSRVTATDSNHIYAWALNDASGNFADSIGGQNLTATGTSNITYQQSGLLGDAAYIYTPDSSNALANAYGSTTTSNLSTVNLQSLTMEGWFFMNASDGSGDATLMGFTRSGSGDLVINWSDSGGLALTYRAGSFGGPSISKTTWRMPYAVWTYMAVTYDGANVIVYANGTQIYTHALTGNLDFTGTTPKFTVGYDPNNSGRGQFAGLISNVRLSKIARASSYLKSVYKTGMYF